MTPRTHIIRYWGEKCLTFGCRCHGPERRWLRSHGDFCFLHVKGVRDDQGLCPDSIPPPVLRIPLVSLLHHTSDLSRLPSSPGFLGGHRSTTPAPNISSTGRRKEEREGRQRLMCLAVESSPTPTLTPFQGTAPEALPSTLHLDYSRSQDFVT